jgi:ubiquinone/menaquinone biosynthesis C-methylase UbiE
VNEDGAVSVDPSNIEQLRAWDGDQGDYWAARSDRFDEGVAGYHDQLLDAADIGTSDTVLDIGCGSGQTTRDAARRASAGTTLGVDLSSRLIELARRTAEREQVVNVRFLQADAQIHPFPDRHFDVAVSRHGVMFFGDARAAFANIARALRPGGRLALLTWQPLERNEWQKTFRGVFAAGQPPAERTPPKAGSLSDPDQVRQLLTSAGFADVRLRSLTEPMYFGVDADDASRFITGQFGWMIEGLGAADRTRVVDGLRGAMAAHQTERGVLYDSAAWLIEAWRR